MAELDLARRHRRRVRPRPDPRRARRPGEQRRPNPVTNAEFTTTLARVLHRPALLPIPEFGPRLVLGETADEFLFVSQRAHPVRLLETGFQFRFPELEAALRHTLNRPEQG